MFNKWCLLISLTELSKCDTSKVSNKEFMFKNYNFKLNFFNKNICIIHSKKEW